MRSVIHPRPAWRAMHPVGALVCGSLLVGSSPTFAQATYTLMHRFHAGAHTPIGRLVEGPDGALYGTTYAGGGPGGGANAGTIFALRPLPDGSRSFETVHQFVPSRDGGNPVGGLILASDGNLYGLANTGGHTITESAGGTIFRMSPSGSFTTLYVSRHEDDPLWRLVEASDGNFYGATCHGRYNDTSTIFRFTPTGSFTTLHTFYKYERYFDPFRPIEGFCPATQLREGPDGLLYGDAAQGGPSYDQFSQVRGLGTLFRIDPRIDGSPLTVLHAFRGLDGARPIGGLVLGPGGDFYGTTFSGGLFNKGLVYRLSVSGTVTTVHTFRGSDGPFPMGSRASDGAFPMGSLFPSADGALYGTTIGGGLGFGTLFRVDARGVFSKLHAFNGTDGSGPIELMQARDGYFYGVTSQGGPGAGGTVYSLGPDNTVTMLHAFSAEPRVPRNGVIQGTDGNFYGTTSLGNLAGGGTVFKLTPGGELTVLAESESFVEPSGLIQASDGFLYGTTNYGGAYNWGTVFRVGTAGTLTVLHSFADPAFPQGVTQGEDGNFYGTTAGFTRLIGDVLVPFPATIFRIDAAGNLTTLYTFPSAAHAASTLIRGDDGDLYGLGFPGEHGYGMIFKITTTGVFTPLYSFESIFTIGYLPYQLVKASDGTFVGLAQLVVDSDFGSTMFRFDPGTRAVTTVHTFTKSEGGPGPFVQARDGAIYGWTGFQAPSLPPVLRVFRLTSAGLTFIYEAVEADGLQPSRMMQGSDGALYGTMAQGPSRHDDPYSWPADTFAGGVFRLTIPPLP